MFNLMKRIKKLEETTGAIASVLHNHIDEHEKAKKPDIQELGFRQLGKLENPAEPDMQDEWPWEYDDFIPDYFL